MVAKLNELRRSIDAKELALVEFRAKFKKELALLSGEKKALEEELDLTEKLVREASNSGYVKVKCKYFTFPFHYFAGADSSRRSYGREEIRYCESNKALILLIKKEELSCGSGIEFTKVD